MESGNAVKSTTLKLFYRIVVCQSYYKFCGGGLVNTLDKQNPEVTLKAKALGLVTFGWLYNFMKKKTYPGHLPEK